MSVYLSQLMFPSPKVGVASAMCHPASHAEDINWGSVGWLWAKEKQVVKESIEMAREVGKAIMVNEKEGVLETSPCVNHAFYGAEHGYFGLSCVFRR